ncbi:MAG: hypothetical protein EGQ45_02040, partial [Clostridiales bacterium]|nr:hypothetical protein [Clostridiales bacterium]
QIPDLSLATVYRNLARFRSEGAVQVIGCVDGEDRYDGNVAPHGHFICRTCASRMCRRRSPQCRRSRARSMASGRCTSRAIRTASCTSTCTLTSPTSRTRSCACSTC